jgi:aspartyl aminopeptidase
MADNKKTSPKRELLLEKQVNGYDRINAEDLEACEEYNEKYKVFIDEGKTERLATEYAVSAAEKAGFREYKRGDSLKQGDKIYRVNRDKAIVLAVIGSEGLDKGVNIAAAHLDAPRLDIKTTPLYEDSELAYFKTHYYGGIKKYQWLAIPLELHGVIALKSGDVIKVSIGKDPSDPVLVISDLLPHLASEQMKKTAAETVAGEKLNALLGSIPEPEDEGSDRVKLYILGILNEKYGITEADLHSAELSLVPAFNARDVGLDRSMIGAYGHDDRVCSFGCLQGILDIESPAKTAVCVLVDKEEIGSEGVTGMQSSFFDTFIDDICQSFNVPLKACFENSFCISSDVAAAYDPSFPEPYDKLNSARLNYGLGIVKYTGSRGKSGASDASAEVVAKIRRILDEADVVWQMAPLGKVDAGGGGTVAKFMANRNIDTIDAGVPVLSMHAPFEIVAKLDNYMSYKGLKAFYLSV